MSVAFRTRGNLDDEQLSDLLWQHGCTGLWQDGEELVAYFPKPRPLPLAGRWETDTTDYLARYYAELQPVAVGPLVIAPTHAQPTLTAPQQVIWLDPGMAFGTGHHESTYLALAALCALELHGARVLDVGSGSGILAIAADKLGAAAALGIDIDPQTLPVAERNRQLNRSHARFALASLADVPGPFEVIVANLYAELHLELAARYAAALAPGGVLIASGILAAKAPALRQALAAALTIEAEHTRGEWVCLQARRA